MKNIQALETAVSYIENHLHENIGLREVAQSTGYSYYHMTRLFKAAVGESVGCYIAKRRLADAAAALLHTKTRILDIALDHGYESSEAFSRAFREVYHISPYEYRKNQKEYYIGSQKELDPRMLTHISSRLTIEPEIVFLKEIKVAGIRGTTTLKDSKLPKLWNQFHKLRPSIPHTVPGGRSLCICETGQTVYTESGDAIYTEMIGTEVASFEAVPKSLAIKTTAPGKYAVFTHRGSLESLEETYKYIWGIWLLGSKEELDCREDFELYTERFHGFSHPDSEVEICIPIR